MIHRLKTHPAPFDAIMRGDKTFEYRKNDRDFREGDKLVLCRFDPEQPKSPWDEPLVVADVGFVLYGPDFGVPDGYCVLSLLNARTGLPGDRGEDKGSEPR